MEQRPPIARSGSASCYIRDGRITGERLLEHKEAQPSAVSPSECLTIDIKSPNARINDGVYASST